MYFVALVCRREIWEKAAVSIPHDKTESFYKCLIFLDGRSIMKIVEEMDGKSDAWFKEQLADADMDQYGEDFTAAPAEVSAEAALAIANGGYDMLPLPLPPIATEVGMTRCIAHVGGSSCRLKIWFDNFSHRTRFQRGWTNCAHHQCVRYVPVRTEDKALFIAELYAWHEDGILPGIDCKEAHMAHRPSHDAVLAVLAQLVMEDF